MTPTTNVRRGKEVKRKERMEQNQMKIKMVGFGFNRLILFIISITPTLDNRPLAISIQTIIVDKLLLIK